MERIKDRARYALVARRPFQLFAQGRLADSAMLEFCRFIGKVDSLVQDGAFDSGTLEQTDVPSFYGCDPERALEDAETWADGIEKTEARRKQNRESMRRARANAETPKKQFSAAPGKPTEKASCVAHTPACVAHTPQNRAHMDTNIIKEKGIELKEDSLFGNQKEKEKEKGATAGGLGAAAFPAATTHGQIAFEGEGHTADDLRALRASRLDPLLSAFFGERPPAEIHGVPELFGAAKRAIENRGAAFVEEQMDTFTQLRKPPKDGGTAAKALAGARAVAELTRTLSGFCEEKPEP